MSKCVQCGKRGLFLRVDNDGICRKCALENSTQQRVRSRPLPAPVANGTNVYRETESNAIAPRITKLLATNSHSLSVHPDLQGLLWIGDGAYKNYDNKAHEYKQIHVNGITITLSYISADEPSLILTKLPCATVSDFALVPRPPYFPTYAQLTSEQRYIYLQLLENPYDPAIDIGYVFILYYGLERHLLDGDFERAFRVILKLRHVHAHSSFQFYSANAAILTCLQRQRADLAVIFMESLDTPHEMNFSPNLYLFCKHSLNLPLSANDIMRLAKSFEFTNQNYIKKYPALFLEKLDQQIIARYHTDVLFINNFISAGELNKQGVERIPVYANTSIRDKEQAVPLIVNCFKLKHDMYDLLMDAHEAVKHELADMRKQKVAISESAVDKKASVHPIVVDIRSDEDVRREHQSFKHKREQMDASFYYFEALTSMTRIKITGMSIQQFHDYCFYGEEQLISLPDAMKKWKRDDSRAGGKFEMPPVIPCRDSLPDIYMRWGEWDEARRVIERCCEIGVMSKRDRNYFISDVNDKEAIARDVTVVLRSQSEPIRQTDLKKQIPCTNSDCMNWVLRFYKGVNREKVGSVYWVSLSDSM